MEGWSISQLNQFSLKNNNKEVVLKTDIAETYVKWVWAIASGVVGARKRSMSD